MLLRYAHLCARHLAHRPDVAFGAAPPVHRGLRRLPKGGELTLTDLVRKSAVAHPHADDGLRFPGPRAMPA
jgi:hypothetical protein